MGAEDTTHLGGMVIITGQVGVPVLHTELPLAGTDGRGACAVTGEGRRHREGLHPGLPPESSFTYTKRDDVVTKQENAPASVPQPPPPSPLRSYSQWKVWAV